MMKIAHEAPLSIFERVQNKTDIDYALVHLFEQSQDYYKAFESALSKGREVILDNSIFELGEAFTGESSYFWIDQLKPTWYIVPDSLEDKDRTIDLYSKWMETYGTKIDTSIKKIGVVQGKNYKEIVECYNYMNEHADMVAFSFDYSYYENMFPLEYSKYHSWVEGRKALITYMLEDNIINKDKPHHLLGCGLPQEFTYYQGMDFIYSVDTSNPVVHGLLDIKYEENGIDYKDSVKLFTLIDEDVVDKWSGIEYNIDQFRVFCNG